MKTRTLGADGLTVAEIGLGCMGMSDAYGTAPDKTSMIALLRSAADAGVTLFDTAQVYGPFANELLLGEALEPVRDQVKIASKFGFAIDPAHPEQGAVGLDSRPATVKATIEESLRRLRTDHLDLAYQHRVDPQVPIEEVAGAVGELVAEGKVLHFGLSEAGTQTVRRAHAVHPVAAVETEYSLWAREPEADLFPTLTELGIGFVPYSPLGRGFLTGAVNAQTTFEDGDFRTILPRFTPEAMTHNAPVVDIVRQLATEKDVTPGQIAIAWVLSRGDFLVPIPGTTKEHRLHENLRAADVALSPDDTRRIDEAIAAVAILGDRYEADHMQILGR